MRPPLVVPFRKASQPGSEIPAPHWDVKYSCEFVLQSADEAFHHGNRAGRQLHLIATVTYKFLR